MHKSFEEVVAMATVAGNSKYMEKYLKTSRLCVHV